MDKLIVTYSYNGTLLSNKQGTHYWYVQQFILSFKLQKLYWVTEDEYKRNIHPIQFLWNETQEQLNMMTTDLVVA